MPVSCFCKQLRSILTLVKHYLFGLMFLLTLLIPRKVFSAINLNISDLIQKDDHYQITAMVTGMSSSSGTFVQAVFTPKDTSKYFGFTFSKKGEWIKYESTPDKNFVVENFIQLQNDQSITIFIKPDFTDKDYQGPGKYSVKLKRFTLSGTPSDYSNSLDVDLNYATSTPQPTSVITITPTPTKSVIAATTPNSSAKTPTPTPTSKVSKENVTVTPNLSPSEIKDLRSEVLVSPQVLSTATSEIYLATSTPTTNYNFQAELGFATPSSSAVSDKILFVIGASIFSLSGSLLYFRLKNL